MVFRALRHSPRPEEGVETQVRGTLRMLIHEKPCMIPIIMNHREKINKNYRMKITLTDSLANAESSRNKGNLLKILPEGCHGKSNILA